MSTRYSIQSPDLLLRRHWAHDGSRHLLVAHFGRVSERSLVGMLVIGLTTASEAVGNLLQRHDSSSKAVATPRTDHGRSVTPALVRVLTR